MKRILRANAAIALATTALLFASAPDAPVADAAMRGDAEAVMALIKSGADVNAPQGDGMTALHWAALDGHPDIAQTLVYAGARIDPITRLGAYTPLHLAAKGGRVEIVGILLGAGANVEARTSTGGATAMHLAAQAGSAEIITALLDKGANPNAPVTENTLTRTIFTMQWFWEEGATPFIRAGQSSDTSLMKLLLKYKADPQARTVLGDNAMTASAGIGWVEGVTYERSAKENVEAIRMLLDLGVDPNHANNEGRTALMGAAMKGRGDVVLLLVERGAKLETRDKGNRDTDKVASAAAGHTWQAIDYAEGLVRVGVQSAVARPETSALLRKLMVERGLPVPPVDRNILSICVVALCQGE